jgi:hypothetical protein
VWGEERIQFLKYREIARLVKADEVEDNVLMSIILGGDEPNHFKIFKRMHSNFLQLINNIVKKRAIKIQEIKTIGA